MKFKERPLTFVSLYCGCGGFDEGFVANGFKCLGALKGQWMRWFHPRIFKTLPFSLLYFLWSRDCIIASPVADFDTDMNRIEPGCVILISPIEYYANLREIHIMLNLQRRCKKIVNKTANKLRSIRDINNVVKTDETHASINFDVGLALFKNL